MTSRRPVRQALPTRQAGRASPLLLGVLFAAGFALTLAGLFVLRAPPPGSEQPDAVTTEAPQAAPSTDSIAPSRCVGTTLSLSRAALALSDRTYRIESANGAVTEARFTDDALARNIIRLDLASLAEGRHRLTTGADVVDFIVDRTPPVFASADPALSACPGPELIVGIERGENPACGPVTCALDASGIVVRRATAERDGSQLSCRFDTADIAAEGEAWTLILTDGVGNETRLPVDWPVPEMIVDGPASAQPGMLVSLRAAARPAGGDFAVALLAGDGAEPEVSVTTTGDASIATIGFRAPRDSQVVGVDVAYRAAPSCPVLRPLPAEVEVSTDGTARRYDAPTPRTCGNGALEPGEACDAGQGGAGDARCNHDCTLPRCGDGVLNPYAGEQCDGGLGCSSDCLLTCGNGQVEGLERCDGGGETAACNLDCTLARCGDEITNFAAGETCDDGNTAAGDGCSARCAIEGDFEEEDPSLGLGRWFRG